MRGGLGRLRTQTFHENDELVAVQTRDGIALAYRTTEASRNLDEHLVASFVTVPVVERLKSIEIEKENRAMTLMPFADMKRVIEAVEQ